MFQDTVSKQAVENNSTSMQEPSVQNISQLRESGQLFQAAAMAFQVSQFNI